MPRPPDDRRPDPEAFLRRAARDARPGKLKVYLGMAAGVGKTYKMLDDAHHLRKHGVDVVIGYVEPHGRPETEARIGDLEVVPRKQVGYRGVVIEEMDLDAVLRRRPDVVLVDELAHTNAPGSRNEKRWKDVEEILAAGISVLAAVNVQHLEGVQDVVGSVTGIEVRERLPDRVVRDADALVVVDLPVEELRERIRDGKVYAAEKAEQALANFFTEEKLTRLRELTLFQTADHIEAETQESAAAESAAPQARVAAAIPLDPDVGRRLILRASRVAGRMNTRWFAVHVRRSRERPERLSAREHRQLTENVQLAMTLGATVVFRESDDVVGTLLRFAEEENVGVLLVGAPSRRGALARVAPGIVARLVDRADGLDVLVTDVRRDEPSD
ncbi:MAG: histidine kinase [Acidobacteria bacterium]|nr:MAG: histidine kinase [Acidobacteriota bacterium]MCE7958113.1 histidine kinase [Acidobacteria bacterium ACB2]